jgi:regulator of protease activity HflC (stomatin/prohibitin superfamily)
VTTGTILLLAIGAVVVIGAARSVRVVPQQRMDVVERLGRYWRTLKPGLNFVIPAVEAVRNKVDLREQCVVMPLGPMATVDSQLIEMDVALRFRVVDPVRATYEVANFLLAIDNICETTSRTLIGSLPLAQALTSRSELNRALAAALDDITGKWGVRVNPVEVRRLDPVQASFEQHSGKE